MTELLMSCGNYELAAFRNKRCEDRWSWYTVYIEPAIHDIGVRSLRYKGKLDYRLAFPHLYLTTVFDGDGYFADVCVYAALKRIKKFSDTVHSFLFYNIHSNNSVCMRPSKADLSAPETHADFQSFARSCALEFIGGTFTDELGSLAKRSLPGELAAGLVIDENQDMRILEKWQALSLELGVKEMLRLSWPMFGERSFGDAVNDSVLSVQNRLADDRDSNNYEDDYDEHHDEEEEDDAEGGVS